MLTNILVALKKAGMDYCRGTTPHSLLYSSKRCRRAAFFLGYNDITCFRVYAIDIVLTNRCLSWVNIRSFLNQNDFGYFRCILCYHKNFFVHVLRNCTVYKTYTRHCYPFYKRDWMNNEFVLITNTFEYVYMISHVGVSLRHSVVG